ncbi:MAG: alpha-galactosidase [Candidatus Cryptobacteroides sp.]
MRRTLISITAMLSLACGILPARDSRFTRHGTGPRYWIAYEWCYDHDLPLPEDRWRKNIDWMAENLKEYGYDMICNDGWIESAQTIDGNGYITKYCSLWQHGFDYWNSYIASKGMKVGVYYNPLWMTRAAYFADCPVCGTKGITTMDIAGERSFNDKLLWVDVYKEGAEQWIKGYVRHFKELGVTYLRIDFLENYERNYGTEAYAKALRWISEEAGDDIFLSLVMPNCYNHGQTELLYGDMIRVSNDCFSGGWDFLSDRQRGKRRGYWPQYDNVFDGFIAFSDITEPGQLIADGDFMRLASLRDIEECRFEFSLMVMAGSALAVADEYDTATEGILEVYRNRELLALNAEGFVADPLSLDISASSSSCWAGRTKDGDIILGLFNREEHDVTYNVDFCRDLGMDSSFAENIRDLWTHRNLGSSASPFTTTVNPHCCRVFRIHPGSSRNSSVGLLTGCSKN